MKRLISFSFFIIICILMNSLTFVSVTEAYEVSIDRDQRFGVLCRLWAEDEYGNYLSGDDSDKPCSSGTDVFNTPSTTFYVIAHVPLSTVQDKKRGPFHNDVCLVITGALDDWDFDEIGC